MRKKIIIISMLCAIALIKLSYAGNQQWQPLSASVRSTLNRSVSDKASPEPFFSSEKEKYAWLYSKSKRLAKWMDNSTQRLEFLKTVHYEATRAGLDPELVLSVIQTESDFVKYSVSSAGALGYMQVMPFWVRDIGRPEDNLFHLRTNLRYGCTILRFYLNMENGDMEAALARYNGSLGKKWYPERVFTNLALWK